MRSLQAGGGAAVALVVLAPQPGHAAGVLGPDPMPGSPGWFPGLLVLVLVLGVGTTIWRITLARQVAQQPGTGPDQAAAITPLSDDGLGVTYLAANLRHQSQAAPPGAADSPAADRLRELREQGLLADVEYGARRTAIIDGL